MRDKMINTILNDKVISIVRGICDGFFTGKWTVTYYGK